MVHTSNGNCASMPVVTSLRSQCAPSRTTSQMKRTTQAHSFDGRSANDRDYPTVPVGETTEHGKPIKRAVAAANWLLRGRNRGGMHPRHWGQSCRRRHLLRVRDHRVSGPRHTVTWVDTRRHSSLCVDLSPVYTLGMHLCNDGTTDISYMWKHI